jgi:hypothetical protein
MRTGPFGSNLSASRLATPAYLAWTGAQKIGKELLIRHVASSIPTGRSKLGASPCFSSANGSTLIDQTREDQLEWMQVVHPDDGAELILGGVVWLAAAPLSAPGRR